MICVQEAGGEVSDLHGEAIPFGGGSIDFVPGERMVRSEYPLRSLTAPHDSYNTTAPPPPPPPPAGLPHSPLVPESLFFRLSWFMILPRFCNIGWQVVGVLQ